MKKVRYVENDKYSPNYLTVGEFYDVIRCVTTFKDDIIVIRNDNDLLDSFYMYNINNLPRFEDVTHEIRDKVIDEILL